MSGGGPRPALLVVLCAAGFGLLNFPLLAVWDQGAEILGLPMLPTVLFLIWAGLIVALALASERGRDGRDAGTDGDDEGGDER